MPIVTAGQFADLLEVGPQRVSELIRQGMPTTRKGRAHEIDTRAAIDWLIARKTADAVQAAADGEDMLQARTRKARADAARAQIQAAEAANEVLPTAEVDAMLQELQAVVWSVLEPIGEALGPTLAGTKDPAECRQLIFDATRAARAEIARRLEARAECAL